MSLKLFEANLGNLSLIDLNEAIRDHVRKQRPTEVIWVLEVI